MAKMTTARTVLVLVAAALFWAAPGAPGAAAKDLSVKAFYGTWSGSGIANSKDSLYFGITMRDLDVTVHPADNNGFTVEWTTVLRQGGTPDNPDVRRKTASITFVPTDNPRRFEAVDRKDPLGEQGYCWARIEDRTLTVYVMAIAPDGNYALQSYARTISGAGMDLKFTRVSEGEAARSVTGKLVKQSN